MNAKVNRSGLPELLAPCGSVEALKAAIEGRADAVYFGGTELNARMNAKNFGRVQIKEAVERCHGSGVKAYVTVNTQIYDREMQKALEYAEYLWECGADALIVADAGFAALVRKYIPDMELHASTQMTVHNADGAERLYASGFRRVVAAREMSKNDIDFLCRKTKAEIELFVHGAICVSCSGQCLMSSMLGGRSGNRGECAQPCRMSYNGDYPISMKDMCLAGHIPELIESGVRSLKIEGRMKSAGYVYGVTRIYRRLLDERRAADEKEMTELARLFSRGGFTDGYYTGKADREMLGRRTVLDMANSRAADDFFAAEEDGAKAASSESGRESLEIPKKLEFPPKKPAASAIETARFRTAEQIPDSHDFTHVYLPPENFENNADGIILPSVIFDSERNGVRKAVEAAVKKGASHVLLRNIGQYGFAREYGLIPHGDFRFNVYNCFSAEYYAEMHDASLESLILSSELTLPQIRDIHFRGKTLKGAVVYGRLPLMLLEKHVGKSFLRDTRGTVFPIVREGRRELLLNSVPVYMADQQDRLDAAGIEERHMVFSTESKGEVMRIIYAYKHGVIPKEPIRRIK